MSLEDDVALLAKLQAGQRAYKKKAEAVRKRIVDKLAPGEHQVGKYNVQVSKSSYSTWDTERLEAALGDRAEHYKKRTERWQVKSNEVKD